LKIRFAAEIEGFTGNDPFVSRVLREFGSGRDGYCPDYSPDLGWHDGLMPHSGYRPHVREAMKKANVTNRTLLGSAGY
jgi:hypothetical protein